MKAFLSLGCAAIAITTFQMAPAFAAGAADATARTAESSIAEIVVTARRRDESQQTVPVAVTALSGAEIAARSVRDLRDVTVSTPNLSINDSGRGATLAFVSMRGLENTETKISNDPAVGIYVDEVYSARSAGNVMTSMMDVQSVQVLRGVQGTLFGRNNTGGAILITTNKPELTGIHGNVLLGYGSYDRFDYGGTLDMTLIEGVLGVRGAFQGVRADPIGRSTSTGIGFANRHRDQGRISARLKPIEDMTLDFSYDKSRIDENGPIITSSLQPSTQGFYSTTAGIRGPKAFADIEGWAFHSLFEISDALNFKTIISRRSVETRNNLDLDGTALPPPLFLDAALTSEQHQWTAEMQASGTFRTDSEWLKAINYTAGIFYFSESGVEDTIVPFNGTLLTAGSITVTRGDNDSIAGYAQIETNHFDKLFLSAGARYTRDERSLDIQSLRLGACALASFSAATPLSGCHLRGSAKFNYWSYSAGVRYQFTPDINIYLKYDKGQRSGGLDDTPTTIIPFKPEVASGFEAGLKTEFFDRRVRVNLAAFSTKIDELQRTSVIAGPPPYTSVFNAATGRTRGVEAEATLTPFEGLTLQGSLGLLDAYYIKFLDPRPAPNFGIDRSNLDFPDSPATTWSVAATYKAPIDGLGTLTLRADYSYRSHFYADVYNAPSTYNPGYGLLNGRISLLTDESILGGNLDIAVYGKNLTDKHYNGYHSSLFSARYRTDNPRTYGVEARYKF